MIAFCSILKLTLSFDSLKDKKYTIKSVSKNTIVKHVASPTAVENVGFETKNP